MKEKMIEIIKSEILDLEGYQKRQIERNEYYNGHTVVNERIKNYNVLIERVLALNICEHKEVCLITKNNGTEKQIKCLSCNEILPLQIVEQITV